MTLQLSEISRCFQGVVPSIVVTSDANGTPNVTFVSQVHQVDDKHVALSCQFFNKTRRNLDENPRAWIEVHDPVTLQTFRMRIRFLRSEKSGPLFDSMSVRIQAIASHTGMCGVFRLIAADVFAVESVEKNEGFLTEVMPDDSEQVSVEGLRHEVRGLQYVSESINRAACLEALLEAVLESLDKYFGFEHTMILLQDESTKRLVTMASRGYGVSGVGAEVAIGDGLIGMVARTRHLLRISGLHLELTYGRTIRREHGGMTPEVPLPGLPDAQSALVIPLVVGDRLLGVIAAEDRDPMRFGEWDETYLHVIANQIALGVDRMLERDDDEPGVIAPTPAAVAVVPNRRTFTFYANDDCVFVDDEYLIRNVPGRILWKLLREFRSDGRTEFSNRELRVDESLGLPAIKDNLESRLILLRKRLTEKCPEVRIVPTARGRFALQVDGGVELVER
ncbi:MAG TPA: GAF domain-containing protein [Thermoanaerobaculia bacterium]|nr:GAF domain-containing protein [Thermoanaerobaculia bacterium]